MAKIKSNSKFDLFVNKYLEENLQMPHASKEMSQQQQPTSNTTYNADSNVQDVDDHSNQPPKQKTQNPQNEVEYDNEIKSLLSSLPPEIQNKISSSQNLSQIQSAIMTVDPTIKKQIEDYIVHKTSVVPQE